MVMTGTAKATSQGDPNILKKIIADLARLEVYVGIPEEQSSRSGEEITNAELAYIHTHGVREHSMREEMQPNIENEGYSKAYQMYVQEHGSPLWHSPPRPIIEPAIDKNQEAIADKLKIAMQAGLNGDKQGAIDGLNKAGIFAVNKIKAYFIDPENGWDPNSESTVNSKGSDKPLINTGALRQSMTWVVGEKK
jgi:hypothetical protein